MYQPYTQPQPGYPQQQPPIAGAPAPSYPTAQPYGQPFGQVSPQHQIPGMPPSDRESYQSVLPPSVTPGWNDPPSVLPTGHTPNRLTAMRKRPVDPSISGSGASQMGYGAAPSGQTPGQQNPGRPYGSPYSQQIQQVHQQQPQQYQAYGAPQGQGPYGNASYQQPPQHYGM